MTSQLYDSNQYQSTIDRQPLTIDSVINSSAFDNGTTRHRHHVLVRSAPLCRRSLREPTPWSNRTWLHECQRSSCLISPPEWPKTPAGMTTNYNLLRVLIRRSAILHITSNWRPRITTVKIRSQLILFKCLLLTNTSIKDRLYSWASCSRLYHRRPSRNRMPLRKTLKSSQSEIKYRSSLQTISYFVA